MDTSLQSAISHENTVLQGSRVYLQCGEMKIKIISAVTLSASYMMQVSVMTSLSISLC